MTDLLVRGAIDFIDAAAVRGWFEVDGDEDRQVAAALIVGEDAMPATLTPDQTKPHRWKFQFLPTRPLYALDFVRGHAAVRISLGRASSNLTLWKPLAAAAHVNDLNQAQLPFLVKSLSDEDRKSLFAELEAALAPRVVQTPRRHRPERRALFGNAEFRILAGSELVILEMIEALSALGWSCDVTAWSIGQPMQNLALQAGANIIQSPDGIRAFDYDLVWLNNRLEPVFDYSVTAESADQTLFVFGHLDRSWSFAQPGAVVEHAIGGTFLVTAPKGVERLAGFGLPKDKIRLFLNPAPMAFDMPCKEDSGSLGNLIVVSNHAPSEVSQAITMLKAKGIDVQHWGTGGDVTSHRLTPHCLERADAVLTIGKTVPYSLRARRPVYIYDHFGGPGWLSELNFNSASSRNFSGLCCERRLDAEELCRELISGFAQARMTAIARHREWSANYRLEDEVARILSMQGRAPRAEDHRAKLEGVRAAWSGERELALTAGSYFRSAIAAHRAKI